MGTTMKKGTTLEYLTSIELGAIVAFRTTLKGEARTLSGKLVERVTERTPGGKREAIIETKNGSMFTVPFQDVIWVKTGDRWPRWVFEELKKK